MDLFLEHFNSSKITDQIMIIDMGNILVKSAVHDFGIQWVLFVVAAVLKTEKFYDLAGSGTFLYLIYKSLQWGNTYFTRQKIQSGLVGVWALRLGTFLFSRVLAAGSDSRFDKIKHQPGTFFATWTIQGIWVFMTLLPTLIVNSKKHDSPLTTRDYAGWVLWAIGFIFEAVADQQKTKFKANADNAGKFISSGLWSISRHPNYFGEILLWSGLFVSSSSVLRGWEWISAISPVFVAALITGLSGIPMLERAGLKKWGSDPAYQAYLKNTAVLVPYIW